MKNSQKGFTNIILIALVVIFVGALGYVTLVERSAPVEQQQISIAENKQNVESLQNGTADITADWATYENKEIGFSFKHPKKWTVLDNLKINTCCLDLINLENFNWSDEKHVRFRGPGVMKAQFGYSIRTPQPSKQEFINKLVLDSKKEGEIPVLPINEASVIGLQNDNGLEVTKFEGGCCGDVNYVIPIKKDYSEIVSVSVWRKDPLFEKVLSTFKFIPIVK